MGAKENTDAAQSLSGDRFPSSRWRLLRAVLEFLDPAAFTGVLLFLLESGAQAPEFFTVWLTLLFRCRRAQRCRKPQTELYGGSGEMVPSSPCCCPHILGSPCALPLGFAWKTNTSSGCL